MNVTIAIIRPNNLTRQEFMSLNNRVAYLEQYVEIRTVTEHTYMETIVTAIESTPEVVASTDTCYEDEKNVYQLCHLPQNAPRSVGVSVENETSPRSAEISPQDNTNGIASLLTTRSVHVVGPAVFLKEHIEENHTCTPESLDIKDMEDILIKNIIKLGIRIYSSGKMVEFPFIKDPAENIMDDPKNLRWIELSVLNFNFIMFIQSEPSNDINKTATLLKGTHRIYGDVHLVIKSSEGTYGRIDIPTIKKLLHVISVPLKKLKLRENEQIDRKRENESLPMVMNKHCILKYRYKDHVIRCNNCKNKLFSGICKCKGCFRVIYCSEECLRDDWKEHKKECPYKKLPLNCILQQAENTSLEETNLEETIKK